MTQQSLPPFLMSIFMDMMWLTTTKFPMQVALTIGVEGMVLVIVVRVEGVVLVMFLRPKLPRVTGKRQPL